MASNSVIVELAAGDRIQVYMYTFTGLHDKPANRLTQFMGCLLRPLDRVSADSPNQVITGNIDRIIFFRLHYIIFKNEFRF